MTQATRPPLVTTWLQQEVEDAGVFTEAVTLGQGVDDVALFGVSG